MKEFKESDYVTFKDRKCLSYDAVYSALKELWLESRGIGYGGNANAFCRISSIADGEACVYTKKYDITGTLRAIVDGMEKGTQEYEKRLALEEEYGELPFV